VSAVPVARSADRLSRRARRAVVSALATFAALQLGMSIVMDEWLPVLHDAEYGCKLALLRQRQREHPQHALTLVLGSSRSGLGLDPESFPGDQSADGRQSLVFNFAITGCGPVQELQILKRLLRHGVRPDRLLIEVHPLLLHQENGVGEEFWLEVRRMDWRDLLLVSQYSSDRRGLIWRWCRCRICPWYSNRFLILNRVARGWLAKESLVDPWTGLSDYGWLAYRRQEVSREEYQRGAEYARREYAPMLTDYRVTERADQALQALLAYCRREGIETALFVMPEGSQFRVCYGADARRQFDEYVSQVRKRWDVPVYDATTWCDDGDFWDSHHLLPRGARQFSQRFGRQVVAEFVSRPSRSTATQ
jgi:hypothetical protein